MSHPPEREIGGELVGAMHQSTGSYELVIAALAAAAVGFWIDYVFGIIPLFTLIFAVAGFVGAGYSIYLQYTSQMETVNDERSARRENRIATATPESAQAKAAARAQRAQASITARDERISGAQRSAPNGDSVLRANAAFAAKQEGKSQ